MQEMNSCRYLGISFAEGEDGQSRPGAARATEMLPTAPIHSSGSSTFLQQQVKRELNWGLGTRG